MPGAPHLDTAGTTRQAVSSSDNPLNDLVPASVLGTLHSPLFLLLCVILLALVALWPVVLYCRSTPITGDAATGRVRRAAMSWWRRGRSVAAPREEPVGALNPTQREYRLREGGPDLREAIEGALAAVAANRAWLQARANPRISPTPAPEHVVAAFADLEEDMRVIDRGLQQQSAIADPAGDSAGDLIDRARRLQQTSRVLRERHQTNRHGELANKRHVPAAVAPRPSARREPCTALPNRQEQQSIDQLEHAVQRADDAVAAARAQLLLVTEGTAAEDRHELDVLRQELNNLRKHLDAVSILPPASAKDATTAAGDVPYLADALASAELLREAAIRLHSRLGHPAVRALDVQCRYLSTRFTESDLDLP